MTEALGFSQTFGTPRTHSHTLTQQTLLAAPMVLVKAGATTPSAAVMLHDFGFRSPMNIRQDLGVAKMHNMGKWTRRSWRTAPSWRCLLRLRA